MNKLIDEAVYNYDNARILINLEKKIVTCDAPIKEENKVKKDLREEVVKFRESTRWTLIIL